MVSIKKMVESSLEIKHSIFIAKLKPIHRLDEAKAFIDEINETYPDKSHRCYAYVIGDNQEIQKAEDDGEPSGTAGLPILEVLKKHNLTDVCCVVMREFGGIKLGAGGLIRAYAKAAAMAIEKASFTEKKKVIELLISADFDHIGVIEHQLKNHDIITREYTEQAHFKIRLDEADYQGLKETIKEVTKDKAKLKVLSETWVYA